MLSGRAVSRDSLSWLLWSGDGRRNLRQLLYQARQLPGAEDWLVVDSESVTVSLSCDGLDLLGAVVCDVSTGATPLDGLDDVGTEAFSEWVLEIRARLATAQQAAVLSMAESTATSDPDRALTDLGHLLARPTPPLKAVRIAIAAHQTLGNLTQARALWERVTEQIAERSAAEQAEWASLRLTLSPDSSPAIAGIIPRLRTLMSLEPEPLPPTVIADVLGVQLIDVAAAWASINPTDSPPTDLASSALRARLAQALQDHGELTRAADHWAILGDDRRAADLWWSEGIRQDNTTALERCARTLAGTDPDRSDNAWSLAAMGLRLRRDLPEARRVADSMMTHATVTQRPLSLARARFHQAASAVLDRRTDDLDFARNELKQLAHAHPETLPILALLDGLTAALRREMDTAIAHLTAAQQGGIVEQIQGLLALGACYGFSGDLANAKRVHTEGLAKARTLGAHSLATAFLNGLSSTADLSGDLKTARRHMLELLEMKRLGVDGMVVRFAAHNLAVVDIALGRLGEARRMLAASMNEAPASNLRAATFRTRGELERVVGRFAEAAAWSDRARTLYAALERPADVDITLFNTALANHLLTPQSGSLERVRSAAQPVIERGGIYASLVAADMCMAETSAPDIEPYLSKLDGLPVLKETLVRLRYACLAGDAVAFDEVADVVRAHTSPSSLWGRALLATLRPDMAAALRGESDALLARMCDGLLGSQTDPLTQLHEQWWTDPQRNVCTL